MVSIIRLHYPNHECDDELLALEAPYTDDQTHAISLARRYLETPTTKEEEDMDFLTVLDERINRFNYETGYILRIFCTDAEMSAGF